MSATRLATRYAKSLLDLAREKGRVEDVLHDINLLNTSIDNNRDFYLMLKSPIIQGDTKMQVVLNVFSGKISDITENFIGILMRKNREAYLPEIMDAFIGQYNIYRGITPVKITTAVPLSAALHDEIIKKLKASAKLDQIILTSETDESLIGGYILEYDNKLIDNSISRGLAILKDEFDNNDYVRKF